MSTTNNKHPLGEWVSIEEGNDWESIFYTYEGERLNSAGTNQTENSLVLKEGMRIEVLFPDGVVEICALVKRNSSASYCDMGPHVTSVTQCRFGVDVTIHSAAVFFPITRLKIKYGSIQRKRDR